MTEGRKRFEYFSNLTLFVIFLEIKKMKCVGSNYKKYLIYSENSQLSANVINRKKELRLS